MFHWEPYFRPETDGNVKIDLGQEPRDLQSRVLVPTRRLEGHRIIPLTHGLLPARAVPMEFLNPYFIK